MSCNLSSYLDEQKVVCLRIAKASNDGTPEQREWLKTAQILMDRAEDHEKVCKKCKRYVKTVAKT